jgi:DNA uptake protein ComE-like DNA-binding protein
MKRTFLSVILALAACGAVAADGGTNRVAKVKATAARPVDVNVASLVELQTLPGIGPALSQRIVDGRPYATTTELLRVKGIGVKTWSAMSNLVTVTR